jgi:hypothetical protein
MISSSAMDDIWHRRPTRLNVAPPPRLLESAVTWLYIASVKLMSRRLATA